MSRGKMKDAKSDKKHNFPRLLKSDVIGGDQQL